MGDGESVSWADGPGWYKTGLWPYDWVHENLFHRLKRFDGVGETDSLGSQMEMISDVHGDTCVIARNTRRRMIRVCTALAFLACAASLLAAEWTWTWPPAPGDPAPMAAVCPLKYGKVWAYAVEIDDGPKWVSTFAVPFLAQYRYTDAPPGVKSGTTRPFVGSVSAIVGATGNNDSALNWGELNALIDAGWGVMNHSYDHHANHWSGPAAMLSAPQAREDAYWSQSLFAAHLRGGRVPTGAVYANGYTDYNLNNALSDYGIGIATRVGGSSTRDVTSPDVKWMDFTRSYLDETVWSNEWNKSQPMADFPNADKDGPATNNLVIDFTHVIEQTPGSANQERWRTRLKTIESRWAAGGADTLWCAPTAEVADYVRAAKAAKVTIGAGRLSVALPDNIPGSAITLRVTGIGAKAELRAPEGGALYRHGDVVVVTTPRIGLWGAPRPSPRLKCVYEGPAVTVDFPKPVAIAGVTLRVFGNPAAAVPYRLAVRTAAGEKEFARRSVGPGWVVGSQLCPIVPSGPPIIGTAIEVEAADPVKSMTVWAVEDGVNR